MRVKVIDKNDVAIRTLRRGTTFTGNLSDGVGTGLRGTFLTVYDGANDRQGVLVIEPAYEAGKVYFDRRDAKLTVSDYQVRTATLTLDPTGADTPAAEPNVKSDRVTEDKRIGPEMFASAWCSAEDALGIMRENGRRSR
jgi:hypothetical protein